MVDDESKANVILADETRGKALPIPKDPDLPVQCYYCGSMCKIASVRVHKKTEGTWKCLKCCGTITGCYRHYNGMPNLAEMSVEQQHAFWSELQKKTGKYAYDNCLRSFQSNKETTKQKFYANNGEFLPLSVWKTRGFNDNEILAKSTNDS